MVVSLDKRRAVETGGDHCHGHALGQWTQGQASTRRFRLTPSSHMGGRCFGSGLGRLCSVSGVFHTLALEPSSERVAASLDLVADTLNIIELERRIRELS